MSKATVIVTLQQLSIQRSTEVTIVDSFPKHEVEILRLIHGKHNVKVLNEDYHAVEMDNNATQEYHRLVSKYGDKYRPVIDQVFRGGARDVARETGMTLGEDSYEQQSEAVINSRLPPRPGEKKDQEDTRQDAAVDRAAKALVDAARPAPEAPDVTGPANPPAAQDTGTVEVDDGSDDLTHAELREELTRRGIEHKGNASRESLKQLLDDAKEVESKPLGG